MQTVTHSQGFGSSQDDNAKKLKLEDLAQLHKQFEMEDWVQWSLDLGGKPSKTQMALEDKKPATNEGLTRLQDGHDGMQRTIANLKKIGIAFRSLPAEAIAACQQSPPLKMHIKTEEKIIQNDLVYVFIIKIV